MTMTMTMTTIDDGILDANLFERKVVLDVLSVNNQQPLAIADALFSRKLRVLASRSLGCA